MGRFLNNPDGFIFQKEGKTYIRLHEDLLYERTPNEIIVTPKGTESEFASIPKVFWSIIGSPIDFPEPSIQHDRMCFDGQQLKKQGIKFKYSWQETHEIFKQALIDCGVPKWKANLMFSAVYGNWLINSGLRW